MIAVGLLWPLHQNCELGVAISGKNAVVSIMWHLLYIALFWVHI